MENSRSKKEGKASRIKNIKGNVDTTRTGKEKKYERNRLFRNKELWPFNL